MKAQIIEGNALKVLQGMPSDSVNCVWTSPPYWGLRDYGHGEQIGLEKTPAEYVEALVEILEEVRRVLTPDGVCWLNIGDSYIGGGRAGKNPEYMKRHTMFNKVTDPSKFGRFGVPMGIPEGFKAKDLALIPFRVAIALQAAGWFMRCDLVWNKINPMPSNCRDRPTRAHEYIFMITKSARYHYDAAAIREPSTSGKGTRNRRSVWSTKVSKYKGQQGQHFATSPQEIITPCILAGCPEGGVVLDPFCGSGTTLIAALKAGRSGIGIEVNPDFAQVARARLQDHIDRQQSLTRPHNG